MSLLPTLNFFHSFKTFNHLQRDHALSSAITFPSLQLFPRNAFVMDRGPYKYTLLTTPSIHPSLQLTADRSRQHPVFAATSDKTSNLKQHGVIGVVKMDHDSKRKAHLLVPAFFRGYSFVFRGVNFGLANHHISPALLTII